MPLTTYSPIRQPPFTTAIKRALRALAVIGALAAGVSEVRADTVTATWDRNPESNVTGYILSYGTQSGSHPTSINVGNVTSKQVTLNPGQRYYFVVQAYNEGGTSPKSAEVLIDLTVPVTAPSITSLSPTSGAVGASVTINGANFGASQGSSTVRFNGIAAAPTSWTATRIVAPVPAEATSGPVTVTVGGSGSNGVNFTVSVANRAPTLTQPANQSGVENTSVSLALVASDPDGNPLSFSATGLPGGLSVNPSTGVISGTLTSTSAGSYTVTATVSDGSLTNSKTFTWTVADAPLGPVITSLSPTSGAIGTAVTISGTSFGAAKGSSSVRFNGTVASPTSWNATSIVVPVPSGATTGPVTVTVGGVASNGVTFTVGTPTVIKIVQHRGLDAGTTTSALLAFSSNNTTGNFIAVAMRVFGTATAITVTDTRGNAYQRAVSTVAGTDHIVAIYYAENVAGGANTVRVDVTTPTTVRLAILEYSGVAKSASLDRVAGAGGTSTSPNSGSLTTTANGDLLLGAVTSKEDVNMVAGAGYTIQEAVPALSSGKLIAEDQIQATAGTASATATLSTSYTWGAVLAAFKAASSGGGASGQAAIVSQLESQSSEAAAGATAADFDGDGKDDIAVYRPSSRYWRVLNSTTNYSTNLEMRWGDSSVKLVPGDYDGDGKADMAYYSPSAGLWSILTSSSDYTADQSVTLGTSTDVPVPGDYDGDGRTDVAVYQPATGQWQVLQSSTNYTTHFATQWGASGELPVPADYDGDGRTDLAVYRPDDSHWRILQSSTDYSTSFTVTNGSSGDVRLPGDYDGDGRADVATYRPSNGSWSVVLSTSNYTARFVVAWTASSAAPVSADFDGDGRADMARFENGAWEIRLSGQNYATVTSVSWGRQGDLPLPVRP